MFRSLTDILSRRLFVLPLASLCLMLVGVQFVAAADTLLQPDGRINQVAHFGGDALYCVDGAMQATNQYSDFGAGGFRLLNAGGQELWFVPAADIAAAVAEAKTSGGGVLVGEGQGTYGPVRIYAYVTGDGDDYFIFSGYDEFGKPNSLQFKFCIPVGPIPHPDGPGESEPEIWCTAISYKPLVGKAPTIISGNLQVPCDQCRNNRDDRDKRRYYRPSQGFLYICSQFPLP